MLYKIRDDNAVVDTRTDEVVNVFAYRFDAVQFAECLTFLETQFNTHRSEIKPKA